ncbi:MAG: hypothetical protein JO290_05045 [Sphingomonadaceae bacterium]|nr:hypothetical protein [Sphingomonadaceae bacterium]
MIDPQPILDAIVAATTERANALMLARAAAELPNINAALDASGLRLTGHHLRQRFVGTRHRRRDPRLALFVRGTR